MFYWHIYSLYKDDGEEAVPTASELDVYLLRKLEKE